MRKVDSFLKESIRMEGIDICQSHPFFLYASRPQLQFDFCSTVGLTRKTTKDFTFSDGTFIPKGTRINAGLIGLHYDEALYDNPEVFNPFRFADIGKPDGEGGKYQFVATSPEYLPFGHGRHAWYAPPLSSTAISCWCRFCFFLSAPVVSLRQPSSRQC